MLGTDVDGIIYRLQELGYRAIPGKASERLAAYRQLKADLGDSAQAELFESEPGLVGEGAYTE